MLKRKFPILASWIFLSLLTSSLRAQITSAEIDTLVSEAMSTFEVPGVGVAVVKDGKVMHCQGYGLRSLTSKKAADKRTNFAIASNSKAFTAAALAILVDEKKLHWNDKVKEHIPEFRMYNAYVTENFNIEDLLTHRSGLGLGIGDLMFFPDGTDFSMKDIVQSFQHFKPQSAFRTKFDYDNMLYLVAGEVIKRVSGQSYEEFVQQRIMTPLGMNHSHPSVTTMPKDANLASPHAKIGQEISEVNHHIQDPKLINGAAGGLMANVDDLCQWMLVQLNGGRYGEGLKETLFSAQRQKEMWRIHTVQNSRPSQRYRSQFRGYGLGWGITDMLGHKVISHTGGLPGMLSITMLVPDLKLGLVVLTNSEGGAGLFSAVSRTILDSHLKLPPINWTQRFKTAIEKRQASGDKVTAAAWKQVEAAKHIKVANDNYIGIYQDAWFGKMEVFMNQDRLWIKAHRSPKLNGALQFYKANSFCVKWEYQDMNADAFAMFNLNEEGKAIGLKLKGISPNIDFSFDFQDLDLKRVK